MARLIDPERRALLVSAAYSVAALAVPAWTTVGSARLGARSQAADSTRVGRAEAASAAAMIRVFSDNDTALGGGYARKALASYLSTTIVPWLRTDTSPRLRRELLTTAARLSYLCGFMCFDDEVHGSAQHYYLTSLRLGAEGGDPYGYAIALRALSVQAHHLGHHLQALDLAEAGVRTASTRIPPHSSAFLLGQLAVAHAAVGNRATPRRRWTPRTGTSPDPATPPLRWAPTTRHRWHTSTRLSRCVSAIARPPREHWCPHSGAVPTGNAAPVPSPSHSWQSSSSPKDDSSKRARPGRTFSTTTRLCAHDEPTARWHRCVHTHTRIGETR